MKDMVVVFEGSLIIKADTWEDDGGTLTFWDDAGVLLAKIPKDGVYTYDIQEAEEVAA